MKRDFTHRSFQTTHSKCQSVARSTSPCSTPSRKGTKREREGRDPSDRRCLAGGAICAAALHVCVIFELFCCIHTQKKEKGWKNRNELALKKKCGRSPREPLYGCLDESGCSDTSDSKREMMMMMAIVIANPHPFDRQPRHTLWHLYRDKSQLQVT